MTFCRPLLCLLALVFPALALGQTGNTPGARLRGAIRSSSRTALAGSALPAAHRATDLGLVPATYPLHGITLVLSRSPEQQAAVEQLLAAQQDPHSPEYHHWLTPDTFAARFGAAESDLQAVEQWLTSQGFTVTGRSHARDRISFSGTAAQVATSFGSPLHRVGIGGEPHIAPIADLTLPSDLAGITAAVLHLSDLRPHPQLHPAPKPAFTDPTTQKHFLIPSDVAVLYDFPTFGRYAPNIQQGQGQSIAVVGQTYIDTTVGVGPIATFHQATGAGDSITPVLVPGTGIEEASPGDQGESDIDLEYTSALSMGANILFVHVGNDQQHDAFDALAFAIDQNLAPIISVSYGQCEPLLSTSYLQQANSLFQQAALQGQTIVAASGDVGATACAREATSSTFSAQQQQVLAVDFPADSPYVTAVGGTQLAPGTFTAGPSTYWSDPTGTMITSLLSYTPEVTWNESSGTLGLAAGGGGASAIFPRPSWQTAPGTPAGSARLLPDIALQASIQDPGFLFCTDDAAFLGSSDPGLVCSGGLRNLYGQYTVGGGTSFSAPIFAAMVAILSQTTNQAAQGNINPLLYQTASIAPSVFHDIVTGTTTCPSGAPRCGAAGEANFAATAGFDQATGLGSLDLLALTQSLNIPTPTLDQTFVEVSPFQLAANPGDTVTMDAVVSSTFIPGTTVAPPTGTLSVSLDGTVVDPAAALTATDTYYSTGSLTYSIQAPATAGSHPVIFTYSGDALHSPSTTTSAILVGNVTATGTLSIAAANLSLSNNSSGATPITITPAGGYDGRLFWDLTIRSISSGTSSLTICYSVPSVHVDAPATTSLTLGVGSACSSALPNTHGPTRRLAASHDRNAPPASPWKLAVPAAGGLLVFGLFPATRRRLPQLLMLLTLAALPISLTGCGSSTNSSGSGSGSVGGGSGAPSAPQPVTYTFGLTAADSVTPSLHAFTTFTVTVQ